MQVAVLRTLFKYITTIWTLSSALQADMMTQEAAYKQIQDAKTMVEDDLQHKLEDFEEERERLIKLANTASNLEMELEQVICFLTSFCHFNLCRAFFVTCACS